MPVEEPRFTDEEVEEVFARAAERQEEGREAERLDGVADRLELLLRQRTG